MQDVDALLVLYDEWGGEHYDEEVAQLDHALQTAARAVAANASEALVAAALLHDVGHLLAMSGQVRGPHEETGPSLLTELFATEVLAPIRLHVEAKRYLCAAEPAYAAQLSAGSTRSLALQGGQMTPDEVAAFEATAGWDDAVALRRWDDAGKVVGEHIAGLATYEPLLRRLACSAS